MNINELKTKLVGRMDEIDNQINDEYNQWVIEKLLIEKNILNRIIEEKY